MGDKYEDAVKELETKKSKDERVLYALEFMKEALADSKKARFQDFWKMKKICLECFKGDIHPTKRNALWAEYTDLLSQAHALQAFLDEQTDFQIEQIDAAILAIGEDFKQIIAHHQSAFEMPNISSMQQIAMKLSALKQRVTSLRKEILNLEMRVSSKNKLLQNLSKIADLIFPKSKEILQKISELFTGEIKAFSQTKFRLEEKKLSPKQSLKDLREQVKRYQSELKDLFMTNHAYKENRALLSQCWECLMQEQERVKEAFEETKQEREKTFGAFQEELSILDINADSLFIKTKEIMKRANDAELGREFMQKLYKEVKEKHSLHHKNISQRQEERKQQEKQKQEKIERQSKELLVRLTEFAKKSTRMTLENIEANLQEYQDKLIALSLEDREKLLFFHELTKAEVSRLKKQAKNLPESEEVVELAKDLKVEIQKHIKDLRSEIPKCGLDIDRVFQLEEKIETSKKLMGDVQEMLLIR